MKRNRTNLEEFGGRSMGAELWILKVHHLLWNKISLLL